MNNFNGLTENIFFENILNYNITYNYQTSFNTPNNYEPTILQSNLIIIDDTLSQLQDDIQDIMFYVNELEYIQEYSRQIVYDRVKYNNNLNYNMCVICQDNFSENEEICKLECDHLFHIDCIEEWSKHKQLCCICQKSIKLE